jgi:perosamine synthetase
VKIPVSAPSLSGNEEAYILSALRSSWISSSGEFVDRFEREFAALTGTQFSSATANGTTALHLALLALGAGPGDEVIVPTFAYVAAANAVKYVGAEPVLVDVDSMTWCLDASRIEAALTPRTRGILAVHTYGHPCDMDALKAIADAHNLWIIEDAAEAHFAQYKGRTIGSLSDVATFSFYGNKVITSGEGGALTYNDENIHKRIRLFRSQGMDPTRRYYHPVIGYNYRLTNIACALLCAQLERRDELVIRRREIFEAFGRRLGSVPGIDLQPVANWAQISPWLYCITVDDVKFGMDRDALALKLGEQGIDTRPFFISLHMMPPYADKNVAGKFPVSERLTRTGMNLPTYVDLLDETIEYICNQIARLQSV